MASVAFCFLSAKLLIIYGVLFAMWWLGGPSFLAALRRAAL